MQKISSRDAELIRLIATGTTLSSAAGALTVTTSRARQLLTRACRLLRLPDGVREIQANPQQYLDKVQQLAASYREGLRLTLEADLVRRLALPTDTAITPQLLARYSASQLTSLGFTIGAVAEMQAWLAQHDQRFRHGPIRASDMKALNQALNLLEAFHCDVSGARAQLDDDPPAAT